MTTPSRRILTRTVIAIVALLFASAGFVSLWRLVEERDRSLELFRAGSWTAVQAEIEALRLLDSITAFHHGEEVSHEEVLRRFEIFWSRIPLLLEGEEAVIVRQLMPQQKIENLFAQLPRIERAIRVLTPTDEAGYQMLRADLERIRSALHDIVLSVMAHDTAVENKERMIRSYTEIFASFMLVIVCGSLLLMMLLRELRGSSRLLEQSQQAAREAAEANRSKSRFLAAASHDLRQPLNALSLLLGLLRSRVKDPSSEELIERGQESLARIAKQLDSYLDITKLDTGRIPVERTAVPVGAMFRRLADMFVEEAQRKGLRLRVVDCNLRVDSDSFLLERILTNLVANAIRYTERGSVLIGARRRGSEIRIDVIDTGPGIAPEHQAAVFDEFFQIANPGREYAEGHGLGLSIVRRLVALLGHRLELQSTPGRGSRFSVVLGIADKTAPLAAPAPEGERKANPPPVPIAPAPAGDAHGPDGHDRAVLIIENDALIAMSMSVMIGELGERAITATSTETAIDLVTEQQIRPRLIIADYRLPGRNGIDAVDALRRLLSTDIPACIITGDVDPNVKSRAFERNIGYLSKPITPGDLRSVIVGTGQS